MSSSFYLVQIWNSGQQCVAISRQDKAGYFLGFSFPRCAVALRPKCFIKIIFMFGVVEQIDDSWSSRGFPFFLSINYCYDQVLVTSYFPAKRDSLPFANWAVSVMIQGAWHSLKGLTRAADDSFATALRCWCEEMGKNTQEAGFT